MKELGPRAIKNRLQKYLEENFNDFEMIEDISPENPTSLKFQTENRIITLICDVYGNITEDFRMRKGFGTKAEFLAKQNAFNELTSFVNANYSDDIYEITKQSFDESEFKIRSTTTIFTITYDFAAKEIVVKERVRRGMKNSIPIIDLNTIADSENINIETENIQKPINKPTEEIVHKKRGRKKKIDIENINNEESVDTGIDIIDKTNDTSVLKQNSLNEVPDSIEKRLKRTEAKLNQIKRKVLSEQKEITTDDKDIIQNFSNRPKKFKENQKVRNIYSGEIYTIVDERDTEARVYANSCSYLMAIADLEIYEK